MATAHPGPSVRRLRAVVPTALALATALLVALAAGSARGAAAGGDDGSAAGTSAASNGGTGNGELRLRWQPQQASSNGPLAVARALDPTVVEAPAGSLVAEAQWRRTLQHRAAGLGWQLGIDALAQTSHAEGGATASRLRANELFASVDGASGWTLLAGKKVVGWDVGQGFRPNDVVQQESRRTLLALPVEGRPLLQAEHFAAERALSLVWVNPQRAGDAAAAQRGADESALAGRVYWRLGATDAHVFGRWGQHSRGSLGAAFSHVASDDWSVHGSLRVMQRHDGWTVAPTAPAAGTGTAPSTASANPWQIASRGGAAQALVGASWTGAQQQSLLVEAWHDGSALSDAEWRGWQARNAALPGAPLLAPARAGALAWAASPLQWPNLRRDNLFVRLAWQPDAWTASLDLLLQPADRGHALTAALQWQGDRWRLNAAWRRHGGPSGALLAQLPARSVGVLSATWAF